MKNKKNIISFSDGFREQFIKKRARKYNLPIDYIRTLVLDQELHGFEITNRHGRAYIDDYISVNAVRYHQ
jgi:hypothetical protein